MTDTTDLPAATLSATSGDMRAVIDTMRELHQVDIHEFDHPDATAPKAIPLAMVPKGMDLRDVSGFLDAWRDRPRRRTGTATLLDLASFIAHVNRFQNVYTGVFCDNRWRQPTPREAEAAEERRDPNKGWKTPSLTAVIDYHEAVTRISPTGEVDGGRGDLAQPRFGAHRATYAFPLSEEFMAWMGANGEGMDQGEFAAFVEERALDIEAPPITDDWFTGTGEPPAEDAPAADKARYEFMTLLRTMTERLKGEWAGPEKMMDLSRSLKVNERNTVEGSRDVASGQGSVVFKNEHTDEAGAPVKVPNLFLISIPVFKNGPRYWIPVRLRYRIASGRVVWFYDTYRHDRVFDHALSEALARVEAETGLAVLVGTPEA